MSIKSTVIRALGTSELALKRNSPHISFGIGVAGVLASTVLACRATLKLEKTVAAIESDLHAVHALDIQADYEQSKVHYRKDIAYTYAKGSFELVRLYAPAIAVGIPSLALLTSSHVQLTRRNTALTVAYTGLHEAYNQYRERVRDAVGEERERDIFHGVKIKEIKDEDGKTKKLKTIDPNALSVYAKIFDELNPNYTKDAEVNRLFIQCQQQYANDLLQAKGFLFLNDVYDMLGFDRTQAGQVVGWRISDDGDNYVDFGLFDCTSSRFVNNIERSIVLDFNVNGVILYNIPIEDS